MFSAYPALALNADYRPLSYYPLSVWPAEQALKLLYEGVCTKVAEYEAEDAVAHSPSTSVRLPSVVALRAYVRPTRHVAFTRFNVFLRDRFHCQYCGQRFRAEALTFDHVIPRAIGGKTSWSNVVTACEPCNTSKRDRLLVPLREPFRPTIAQLARAQRAFPPKHLHESWIDYLFWDSELES